MEAFADQNESPNEGPTAERQQGSLAQMLAEGRKAIGTHDTSNLFSEEDTLTEAQQAAIKRNTELMQRAHKAFVQSEKLRKIDRVKEVCPQATDEEAWQAVTLCEGKEEEAAAQIADPVFLVKVQTCCRQAAAEAAAEAAQPLGAQQAQRAQRSRAPAAKRPKRVNGEALPGSVFVGSFRGRGPLPAGTGAAQRSTAQRDTAAAPASEPPEPITDAAAAEPGPELEPSAPGRQTLEAGPTEGEEHDDATRAPDSGSSGRRALAEGAPEGAPPAESGGAEHTAAAAAEQPARAESGEGGPAKGAASGKGKKKRAKRGAAAEPEEAAAAAIAEKSKPAGEAAGEAAPQCSDPEEGPSPLPRRASQRKKPKGKGAAAESAPPDADLAAPPCSNAEEGPAPPKPASKRKPKRKGAAAESTLSDPDQGEVPQPLRRSPRKHRAGPSKASSTAAAAAANGPADVEVGGSGPQGGGSSPQGDGCAADNTGAEADSEGAAVKPAKKKARAGKKEGKGGVAVPRGAAHRGRVRRTSSKAAELVSVGTLRAAAGWFNEGYIFPEGFQSRVHFRSSVQLDQLCVHECHIVGRGGEHWPAPTFRVVALDRSSEPLIAKSCTGCWTGVLKRINAEIERRRAEGEDLPPAPKTAIAGPEYFGLNQEDVQVAIEALDPDHDCEAYWEGKARRAAVAAGLPPAPKGPRPPGGGARASSARGGAGKKRRRGASSDDESAEEADREEDEEGAAPHRCSAADRRERYRARHGSEAGGVDSDNPLPGLIDPITLGPVVNPAISPHGHVCGLSTWKAVLANDNACPWTRQHFSWEACTVLTHSNIERFRAKIKAADPPPPQPQADPAGGA